MTRYVEPLDKALWFRQIEKIASGGFASMEHALRHASHLVQLTPAPFRDVVLLAIGEDGFEALLEAGDLDSAARHLIAQPTALSIEDHEDGSSIRATISCAILNRAIHGMGDTVASAVLSAWTTCLLALDVDDCVDPVSTAQEARRTAPRGPDRRISWRRASAAATP